jgi:hypothetical protein
MAERQTPQIIHIHSQGSFWIVQNIAPSAGMVLQEFLGTISVQLLSSQRTLYQINTLLFGFAWKLPMQLSNFGRESIHHNSFTILGQTLSYWQFLQRHPF